MLGGLTGQRRCRGLAGRRATGCARAHTANNRHADGASTPPQCPPAGTIGRYGGHNVVWQWSLPHGLGGMDKR